MLDSENKNSENNLYNNVNKKSSGNNSTHMPTQKTIQNNNYANFKSEIEISIKEMHSNFTKQINLLRNEINFVDNKTHTTIVDLNSNISNLNNKIIEMNVFLTSHINSFESYKIVETLQSNTIKTSLIDKDLKDLQYKYDKVYLENFSIPGLCGPRGCKFASLKELFKNNYEQIIKLNIAIDKIKTDIQAIKDNDNLISQKINITNIETQNYAGNLIKLSEENTLANLNEIKKEMEEKEKINTDLYNELKQKSEEFVISLNGLNLKLNNDIPEKINKEHKLIESQIINLQKIKEYTENYKKNFQNIFKAIEFHKKLIDKCLKHVHRCKYRENFDDKAFFEVAGNNIKKPNNRSTINNMKNNFNNNINNNRNNINNINNNIYNNINNNRNNINNNIYNNANSNINNINNNINNNIYNNANSNINNINNNINNNIYNNANSNSNINNNINNNLNSNINNVNNNININNNTNNNINNINNNANSNINNDINNINNKNNINNINNNMNNINNNINNINNKNNINNMNNTNNNIHNINDNINNNINNISNNINNNINNVISNNISNINDFNNNINNNITYDIDNLNNFDSINNFYTNEYNNNFNSKSANYIDSIDNDINELPQIININGNNRNKTEENNLRKNNFNKNKYKNKEEFESNDSNKHLVHVVDKKIRYHNSFERKNNNNENVKKDVDLKKSEGFFDIKKVRKLQIKDKKSNDLEANNDIQKEKENEYFEISHLTSSNSKLIRRGSKQDKEININVNVNITKNKIPTTNNILTKKKFKNHLSLKDINKKKINISNSSESKVSNGGNNKLKHGKQRSYENYPIIKNKNFSPIQDQDYDDHFSRKYAKIINDNSLKNNNYSEPKKIFKKK